MSQRHRAVHSVLPDSSVFESWLEVVDDLVESKSHLVSEGDESSPKDVKSSWWKKCREEGCLGEVLSPADRCFAHVNEQNRNALFFTYKNDNKRLPLRGVYFSRSDLDRLIDFVQSGQLHSQVDLAHCEMETHFRMSDLKFFEEVDLRGAVLHDGITLENCVFRKTFSLVAAIADGLTSVTNCKFERYCDISFFRSERHPVSFVSSEFRFALNCTGFNMHFAGFVDCRFHEFVILKNSRGLSHFGRSRFDGRLELSWADQRSMALRNCDVQAIQHFEGFNFGSLTLDGTSFDRPLSINGYAGYFSASGSVFNRGGSVRLSGDWVDFDNVRLGGPLRLSGRADGKPPALRSLSNTDAGRLSIESLDLSWCSFANVHDLGGISLGSDVMFARGPLLRRRKVVADEFAWRQSSRLSAWLGWRSRGTAFRDELVVKARALSELPIEPQRPVQLSSIYRELRRSAEARSNMPGAADFYYGEMEMLRQSLPLFDVRRALVTLYWVGSGYGVRPLRSFFCWLLVWFSGALALATRDYSYSDGIGWWSLQSLRAAIPGLPLPEGINELQELIFTLVRVLGTLFLALTVLAIKNVMMRKPSE